MSRLRLLVLLSALSLSVQTAFALPPDPALIPEDGIIGNCNFITGDIHYECVPLYLSYLMKIAFGFAGGFALNGIIQAGYELSFSGLGGDTQAAKKRLSNCIIGLCVCVFAFLIVDTVVSFLFLGP